MDSVAVSAASWGGPGGARTVAALSRGANLAGILLPAAAVPVAAVQVARSAVTARDLVLLGVMYLACATGLTVGFHRMLTHRAFEARPATRFVLLALGCTAGMSDPVRFAAIHLQHHARADRDGDPHSPVDGLLHAHLGWFVMGFEPDPRAVRARLLADPMVRFFHRTAWWWTAAGFAAAWLAGGWSGLLWGGFVRYFLTVHVTFAVNSIGHRFGTVAFRTTDGSRNNGLLGVLALGEGWHNNHHAFPRSAFLGLGWRQVDVGGYLIAGLERLRLVHGVHRVSPALVARRRVHP